MKNNDFFAKRNNVKSNMKYKTLHSVDGKNYKPPSKISMEGNWYEKNAYSNQALLPESEKQKGVDSESVKRRFFWYKSLGVNQVRGKYDRIQKHEDLVNGVIHKKDFVNSEEIEELRVQDPTIKFDEDSVDLEYFPIVPNLINRLEGIIDKHYIGFTAIAENPHTTNEILETRNAELKASMEKLLADKMAGKEIDPEKVQADIQERLKYYSFDYRHEIEEWANIVIGIENKKFNMPSLNRRGFRELLTHEEPFYHVNLIDDYYYPELLNTKNTFYIKSELVQDASDYTMFGWFEYSNLNTVLNKYQLTQEQTESLTYWSAKAANLVIDGTSMFDNSNPVLNSLNNYQYLQGQYAQVENKNLDPNNRLLRITTIYWLEPRKVGLLTVMIDGKISTIKVDETFKITKPPKYQFTKKDKKYLTEGEHVEWIYINELYKGVEISPDWSIGNINSNDFKSSIFLHLGKHDIQYSHKGMRYGIKIPVHGGSVLGWSVASRTYSWQRFYNYLGNRNKQLLYTELGKFVLMNQNSIPDTSLEGTWGEDKLLKFFIQAKELSLGMTDNSIIPGIGGANAQGFGQVIDLNKTQDVMEKFNLMRMIKMECYESVGLSVNSMQDSSPYQTATSASINQDTAITQLSYLFSRHYDIMRNLRETMLETALYLTSKGEYRELAYTTSDKQRGLFPLTIKNTLLHDLSIYMDYDMNDVVNLEKLKQYLVQTNTLGADATDMAKLITSKSQSDVFGRLKELTIIKEKKIEEERAYQKEMQQSQIDSAEKLKQAELTWKAHESELDRLNALETSRIKAIGFGNSTSDEISKELIQLQELKLKEADFERSLAMDEYSRKMQEQSFKASNDIQDRKILSNQEMELAKLNLQKEKLDAERHRTNALLAISKENNRDNPKIARK